MSGQPYAPPGHLATRWHLTDLIPRGIGNKEIVATAPFREAARHVTEAIARIASEMSWKIERVAIDAPAAPPSAGSRLAEDELGHIGLSSFRTPTVPAWADIRIRLNGTDLPAIWHDPATGQINALLPAGLEPGKARVSLVAGDRETEPLEVELYRS